MGQRPKGVLHYRLTYGWAACDWNIDAKNAPDFLTSRPPLVTCGKCKQTKEYRQMMED